MGVCQQPKKPGKNNLNYVHSYRHNGQSHTSTYYHGQIKHKQEIENNKIFNQLIKEKEKKLEKQKTLKEKEEEKKEEEKKEEIKEEGKKEEEKNEEEKKEEKKEEENKMNEKLKNIQHLSRRKRFKTMKSTTIEKPVKIFNFDSDEDEEKIIDYGPNKNKAFNRFITDDERFKRKDKKSYTLIEKVKFGDQLFKEELNLKISNQTLIEEKEGIPNNKFKIISKLKSGNYASVFLANNTQLNTMVTLKRIDRRIYILDDSIQKVINNFKLLEHPNIIRIHECFISPKYLYLVNDYCSCGELFYNKKNSLSEHQLAFIFFQILSALIYLHHNNIIHRDIKLENILISDIETDEITKIKYYYIKVIDFGKDKFILQNLEKDFSGSNIIYIAPEVLKRKYNEKCDIWSVGVLLHILLVGKAPFEGGNPTDTLNKIRKGKFNTNDEKFLQSSEEVKDLIIKLLEVKVEKRLSAKEAIEHPWFSKFEAKMLYNNLPESKIIEFINRLLSFKIKNKFQQIVLAFIVHNIKEDQEVRDIQKLFRIFNQNNDGLLNKEEFYIGLCKYKDENEINDIIDGLFLMLDSSNSGYIQFEQFLRATLSKEKILSEKNLLYAFNFIDKQGIGKLTVDSIKNSFGENENISSAVFENIYKEVNHKKENEISFDEFKDMMFDN